MPNNNLALAPTVQSGRQGLLFTVNGAREADSVRHRLWAG